MIVTISVGYSGWKYSWISLNWYLRFILILSVVMCGHILQLFDLSHLFEQLLDIGCF